jgi:hypothetical protein
MVEEKKEPWLNYLALTTVILAVCATLSTFKGGGYSTRSVLTQSHATNQWAYYQAKAGREHFYRGQKMRLELDLLEKETLKPEIRQRYATLLKEMATQEERYGKERKDIEKEARKLEHERDIARGKDPYFDFSEVLLQIAIVMATVAILSQSRAIFGVALGAAVFGALLCLNGFLMLFHLPFLSH